MREKQASYLGKFRVFFGWSTMTASEWVRERDMKIMYGGKWVVENHTINLLFLDSTSHDWENAHNKFPLGSSASGKSPLISLNLARLHNYLKLKVTQTNTRFHYPFKFFIILLLIRKRPPSASTKFDEYNFLFSIFNKYSLSAQFIPYRRGWLIGGKKSETWMAPGRAMWSF